MAELSPERLASVVLGLGAADGYAAGDLTNVRDAALAGEVPYLPAGSPEPAAPLELRIHGVGGAPPRENLETPSTLQVSGDGTAGFHRAWYPGGSALGKPQREAYCWGGLNTRSWTRALWLLLVGFMFINLAHWALPASGPRWLRSTGAAVLRLLGLALTLSFVGTTLTILADVFAWQAAPHGDLPSWTGLYTHLGDGPRFAIALLAVLTCVAVLCWLSVATTQAYEKWTGGGSPDTSDSWQLTDPNFWDGDRPVTRQRWCHVAAAAAEVLLFAVVPRSSHDAVRTVGFAVAAAIVAVVVILLVTPWTDRAHAAGREQRLADRVCRWFAILAVAVASGAALARFWWRPRHPAGALPGDERLTSTLVFVGLGLVVVLAVVVCAQRAWQQQDVMAHGFTAVLLALLGFLLGTIFAAALTLATANVLGTPQITFGSHRHGGKYLYLPSTVYAGGLGLLAALAAVVVFGVGAWLWMSARTRRWAGAGSGGSDSVADAYPAAGGDGGPMSRRRVASVWAESALTDLAPVGLAVVVIPVAGAFVGYEGWLVLNREAGNGVLRILASIGATLGVLATGYFLIQLRRALTSASARMRLGFLWDVGTFWPRAVHPLAPPCYAERSIPELVTRVRRLVGDTVAGPDDPALAQQLAEAGAAGAPAEAHRPVLITGYSQGTPIAVAVVAQLPAAVRDRVALLTLAAPVRRLYGRAFPACFGPEQLALLETRLTDGAHVRWRNLVRRSDYIGGWARRPIPPSDPAHPDHAGPVDREVYDPPALWGDHDPTPPPSHRHLDFFADPQTRPYSAELAALLAPPVRPLDAAAG